MSRHRLTRRAMMAALAATALAGAAPAFAGEKKYDPGASDTEIRIGNTYPYSGPASSYGVLGQTSVAYFRMVNDRGGINGRKVTLLSYDDAYSPPKAVEQTRKLVEQDEVLAIFNTFGSPANAAIQRYLNSKKVPQLFVATGASRFNDPKNYPWTMGFQPNTRDEAAVYVAYIRKEKPDAKIGILYQNDDFGKDYLEGVKAALGADYGRYVVAEVPYDVSEPTVDSHVLKLMASGADTLFSFSTPKFAAQTIRKMASLNWKPLHVVATASASASMVMKPAGLENSQGIITSSYMMNAEDPAWKDTEDMKEWRAFMEKYMPGADLTNTGHIYGYIVAQAMHKVLEMAGDNLTRENVMRQAESLKNVRLKGFMPGIVMNTSPTDHAPIKKMQILRFKGDNWERVGEVIGPD
ncbi:ABC transporter substrate-binding protein [Camelimonas abortus]|uniref:ABC transporter substrate-binding protein n=1 Tax=Camelimonas abortus TaxID=1017184 RepID=A0ABV7LGN0_9HYPH